MSCFTLAVLLHYLRYAVSLSHKQISLKICIMKAQELLEDIIHTATLRCIAKTASNCWKHFELCSSFTFLLPFPSQSRPFD